MVGGEILWEVGIQEVKNTHKRFGPECLKQVRETLDKWLTQESLAPKQRAAAGVARAWLEDLPVGVGIIETAPKRPDFLWCGAKGEVSAGEGNPLRKAFPKLPGFKLGEPKGRQHRAWGSFTQFDCTRITKPFFISMYPVTVAQYQLFVEAGGYEREDDFWTGAGREWRQGRAGDSAVPDWLRDEYRKEEFPITRPKDYGPVFQTPNHPRVGVCWFEALAFCRWLNSPGIRNHLTRDSGLPEDCAVQIRLPSEAEWELAARWNKDKGAPDDRLYPWPDEKADIDLNERCNWDGTKIGNTSAVGLFPKGNADCGAADLAGNVWEWCQTKWVDRDDKDAPKRFNSGVYDADDGEETRVLRGGSWVNVVPANLRAANRNNDHPGNRNNNGGFRVVVVCG